MTESQYRPTELPDSGMMTGSEGGDPGDRLDSLPLTDAERAVLEQLRSASASVAANDATLRAASDETALPASEPPTESDPLTPIFQPPSA